MIQLRLALPAEIPLPDPLFRVPGPSAADPAPTGAPAAALERASACMARLDQALASHPLLPAFVHRARLEAARHLRTHSIAWRRRNLGALRQAAADGQAIDPWHLAAVLEGLRLRMDHALRIVDRGAIFAAARHALHQHQWLTAPDFDQEGAIQRAEAALAAAPGATPLLAAARGLRAWLDDGGARQSSSRASGWNASEGEGRGPMRAALIRTGPGIVSSGRPSR